MILFLFIFFKLKHNVGKNVIRMLHTNCKKRINLSNEEVELIIYFEKYIRQN